jgi:Multiubiquitin
MSTDKEHGKDKDFTVIVNGREKTVASKELTFEQVVTLAFDNPPTGENILFTITYRKGGNEHKPEGSMVEGGDPVKVKNGMIFNVTATDKS